MLANARALLRLALPTAVALAACTKPSAPTSSSEDAARAPVASASGAAAPSEPRRASIDAGGPAGASAPMTALDRAVDAFYAIQERRQVAISPDGQVVVWVDWTTDKTQRARSSAIYLLDRKAPKAAPKRITAGTSDTHALEGNVAFSPDSQTLAFLSDAGSPGQPQLYVFSRATFAATKITDVRGYLTTPCFAPDNKSVAVLFTEEASHPTGALEAIPTATGVVDSKIDEQRIAIVDVATHGMRVASPADMFVYDYDWSPDGKQIAAVAAKGHGESQYWVVGSSRVDLQACKLEYSIVSPK